MPLTRTGSHKSVTSEENEDLNGGDEFLYGVTAPFWSNFWYSPSLYLARKAFAACMPRAEPYLGDPLIPPAPQRARIVCISDTHNQNEKLPPLPPGDILIHAGDLSGHGRETEVDAAFAWLHSAPHAHKIVIAGNHDTCLENETVRARLLARYPGLTYLHCTAAIVKVRGRYLAVYGHPYSMTRLSPARHGAFQYSISQEPKIVRQIPPFIDVLVTHGPPAFHLDHKRNGCRQVLNTLWDAVPYRPRLHVFGHIHVGRGVRVVDWSWAQRKYEAVCRSRKNRVVNALLVAAAAGVKILGGAIRVRSASASRLDMGTETVLVNACSENSLKSKYERWRGAIVVDIPLPERNVN